MRREARDTHGEKRAGGRRQTDLHRLARVGVVSFLRGDPISAGQPPRHQTPPSPRRRATPTTPPPTASFRASAIVPRARPASSLRRPIPRIPCPARAARQHASISKKYSRKSRAAPPPPLSTRSHRRPGPIAVGPACQRQVTASAPRGRRR